MPKNCKYDFIDLGNMKPTIGIVGGCGPLATVDIERKILSATKRLLSPLLDQDYFNMLVFNNTQFSDRNDAIVLDDRSILDQFLHCARSLESIGIDLLLIACQTAHVYVPALRSSMNCPLVDIVQETVSFFVKHFPNDLKVGLLSTEATQKKGLYQDAFESHDVEVICVSSELQNKIMEAIYIIKSGANIANDEKFLSNHQYCSSNQIKFPHIKNHPYRYILLEKSFPNPLSTVQEAINYLANKGCQHVILGCTELPLILPYMDPKTFSINVIDPNTIVAESVVILAHKIEKERMSRVVSVDREVNEAIIDKVLKICVE